MEMEKENLMCGSAKISMKFNKIAIYLIYVMFKKSFSFCVFNLTSKQLNLHHVFNCKISIEKLYNKSKCLVFHYKD